VVLQFLVDHVERTGDDGKLAHDLPPAIDDALVSAGFKGTVGAPALNTVLHRLSVLSKAHQMRDFANPTKDPAVQELVRRIRRAYAQRGESAVSKTALTKGPLEAMMATCTDGLIGIRDCALLSFAFSSGGRRRSEVARALMEHLMKVDEDTYVHQLTHSKTD
jgi:integrase